MDYPKEIIRKIYQSLPDELQVVVATPETVAFNDSISKNNSLNKEQRLALGDEVTMRLLGITKKESFKENLKNRLQINEELVTKILNEINSNILSKIPEKVLTAQEEYAQAKLKEWLANPQITEQKVSENQDLESFPPTKTTELEVPPANLPMIEPGEVAHDTAPKALEVGSKEKGVGEGNTEVRGKEQEVGNTNTNQNAYSGQDPYREPLE